MTVEKYPKLNDNYKYKKCYGISNDYKEKMKPSSNKCVCDFCFNVISI